MSASLSSTPDVVLFPEHRLNAVEMDKLIKTNQKTANPGLSNENQLNQDLSGSNYIPVLKAVWCERDREKRLSWLREKSAELHAPLLYELAIAEFAASPTAETVNLITIPLIKAASFRVLQDIKCLDDNTLSDSSYVMEMTYISALENLVSKKIGVSLESLVENSKKERLAAINEKVTEIANQSMKSALPNPLWVGTHSMHRYTGSSSRPHPQQEWEGRRKQFALETNSTK